MGFSRESFTDALVCPAPEAQHRRRGSSDSSASEKCNSGTSPVTSWMQGLSERKQQPVVFRNCFTRVLTGAARHRGRVCIPDRVRLCDCRARRARAAGAQHEVVK
eukprot:3177306-Pyramimonas_sp.AAC.1